MKKFNLIKLLILCSCFGLLAINNSQASTVTIQADGSSVTGVGLAHFFTDVSGSLLDLGDQVRVGFFNVTSLNNIVANFNSYTDFTLLRSNLDAIFTPIGETGYAGTATGGKVAINDKQNLTSIRGAISQNITSLDPVASGHAGKQVYLWATDSSNWSTSTALAIVTDVSWIIPSNNSSNLTVNTAFINTASSSELVLGISGPTFGVLIPFKWLQQYPSPPPVR